MTRALLRVVLWNSALITAVVGSEYLSIIIPAFHLIVILGLCEHVLEFVYYIAMLNTFITTGLDECGIPNATHIISSFGNEWFREIPVRRVVSLPCPCVYFL